MRFARYKNSINHNFEKNNNCIIAFHNRSSSACMYFVNGIKMGSIKPPLFDDGFQSASILFENLKFIHKMKSNLLCNSN